MKHASVLRDRPALDPNSLTPFVDRLPLGERIRSEATRPSPSNPSAQIPFYRLPMRELRAKLHRDLPATRLWTFGNTFPGPLFETRTGQGLLVEWANELPRAHFLPIDHSLHGAEADKPEVRAVVHLHGAKVGPESDGYPEAWFVPGQSQTCHYPNNQEASMLWYHDHAMGINRLNVYAGLLGVFMIRDEVEDSLGLPHGPYEIPLILCDRMLDKEGQLYYPASADPEHPWIPELFGDMTLVNGKLFPYLEVEPRRYRFRLLNGSNGRFYYLALANNQEFHQIGTDQGLLPSPIALKNLTLAPGERADLIVDFAPHRGKEILFHSDSLSLLQFRVSATAAKEPGSLPATLRPVARIPESQAVKTRQLTLNEYQDPKGPTILMLLNESRWHMPVTEQPVLNTTEIWELVNLTEDSHPIHLHMVRFQILDRRRFDLFDFQSKRKVRFTGPVTPPEPNEAGWKDTVRAEPKMITRIIVRFEGFPGRYVWHCHILEHEDNDMMRPYDVLPAK
jgi:spore coat protein A